MARIAEGLPDIIWANTPASADDVIAPTEARQNQGWNNPYFQPGGELPEGEDFNWMRRNFTAFKRDVGRHGILEWDNRQNFEHPAACLADNNHFYISTADSGPDFPGGAVNPTGATGTTRWRLAGSANQFVPAAQVTGTADAILLAPDPAFTVYEVGQTLIFRAEGDSTAGVTVNVSGLGAQALHFSDAQAGAGDIMNGFFYTIRYDGTNFIIVAESGFHILPVARGGTGVGSIADLLTALNIGNRLIPDGGTDGQVLTKQSAGNYDADWEDAATGGLQTLTEGDHVSITGTGDTREIAVDTGTTQGDLAVLGTGGRFAAARVPMIEDLDGSLTAADIPELQDLRGTLDIASGGTGATTAATARTALGLGTAATEDTGTTQGDIPVLQASGLLDPARVPNLDDLNGTLDVASGGTGATDAAGARTNLSAAAANHNHDGRYMMGLGATLSVLNTTGTYGELWTSLNGILPAFGTGFVEYPTVGYWAHSGSGSSTRAEIITAIYRFSATVITIRFANGSNPDTDGEINLESTGDPAFVGDQPATGDRARASSVGAIRAIIFNHGL